VLKAGGAFTALDPENPPERNSFIVADVEANLVLTDRDHAEIFTNLGVDVILIDELDLSGMWPNVPSTITPDALAYVIYTSGKLISPRLGQLLNTLLL
jgi:non-ribosomal peptide synthetase component F